MHEEFDGSTCAEGPIERSYGHLLSDYTQNLRTMIDHYWVDHLIYPNHVREFLGQKDVDLTLHRPLWTKLPYEEAGILFALEQSGHLSRWRPGYKKVDYDRILDQVAFEALKEMVHHAALSSNATLTPTRYPTPEPESKDDIVVTPYSEIPDSESSGESPSFDSTDSEDHRW